MGLRATKTQDITDHGQLNGQSADQEKVGCRKQVLQSFFMVSSRAASKASMSRATEDSARDQTHLQQQGQNQEGDDDDGCVQERGGGGNNQPIFQDENGTDMNGHLPVFQSGVPLKDIPFEKDYISNGYVNLKINLQTDLNPPLASARLKGEGGFGKVYKSNLDGRPVAVKLFKMQYQQYWGDGAEDEFMKELDIVCRLEHENIVKCYGASMKPGEKAIIMEYVDNSLHDLIHRVKREGPMRLSSIFKILKSIAKALEFLHQGVVHRDLHPLNVLIAKDGVIKVADFGISRMMEHSTTIVSEQKGAPAYVAPEVFNNKLTKKSDIYSLGVMAWELWTLKQPWQGLGYGLIVKSVTEGKRPEIPEDTPKELRDMIENCWQQDYDQRPKAKQVYQECHRILEKLTANA